MDENRLEPFEDFMKDIDLSGLEEKMQENGIVQLHTEKENTFVYDLPIVTAHYYVRLHMDDEKSTVLIYYLTKDQERHVSEMNDYIDKLASLAIPDEKESPYVALINGNDRLDLNLENAWEFDTYLRKFNSAENLMYSFYFNQEFDFETMKVSKSDFFRIMFSDRIPGFGEYIFMSYEVVDSINADFVREFMVRNAEYNYDTVAEDSEDLAGRIIEVCKRHSKPDI